MNKRRTNLQQIQVPFCKPDYGDAERAALEESILSGRLEGGGEMNHRCEVYFEKTLGCETALITPSCTAALEMMALALDLQPGDEVIMPAFTFVSTANAIALRGAVPVFVDIDPYTFNIDVDQAEKAISPRTKAIMCVHYAGVGCDMDRLQDMCQSHDLILLEDAAQAIEAYWKDRPLGSFGAMSAFSFHHTKNVTCGEGGVLIVNDESLTKTSEFIRDKGTNRSEFLRGHISKYEWLQLGSSYLLSELAAAVLSEQLKRATNLTASRLELWATYLEAFTGYNQVQLPAVPAAARHNAHIFSLLLPSQKIRDDCMTYLRSRGIVAAPHYVPLHLTPGGKKYGRAFGELPVTRHVSATQLRMPLYSSMQKEDQALVVNTMTDFLKGI